MAGRFVCSLAMIFCEGPPSQLVFHPTDTVDAVCRLNMTTIGFGFAGQNSRYCIGWTLQVYKVKITARSVRFKMPNSCVCVNGNTRNKNNYYHYYYCCCYYYYCCCYYYCYCCYYYYYSSSSSCCCCCC